MIDIVRCGEPLLGDGPFPESIGRILILIWCFCNFKTRHHRCTEVDFANSFDGECSPKGAANSWVTEGCTEPLQFKKVVCLKMWDCHLSNPFYDLSGQSLFVLSLTCHLGGESDFNSNTPTILDYRWLVLASLTSQWNLICTPIKSD